jgi:hypothetical protein
VLLVVAIVLILVGSSAGDGSCDSDDQIETCSRSVGGKWLRCPKRYSSPTPNDPRLPPSRLRPPQVTIVSAKPSTDVLMVRSLGSMVVQPRLSGDDVLYWRSDIF